MALDKQKYIDGAPDPDYTLHELYRSYVLVLGEDEYDIETPIGWIEAPLTLERTPNHGVIVKRGRDGDEIGFMSGNGKAEISAFYALNGPDGQAKLIESVYEKGGTPLATYTARLDFKKRRADGEIIFLGVIRDSVRDLLVTRWDTAIDMQTSNTVDGITPIDDVPTVDLALPSVSLSQTFKSEKLSIETFDWQQIYSGNALEEDWYLVLNTTNPQISEIQTHYPSPMGIFTGPPPNNDDAEFSMLAEGTYRVQLDIDIAFDCRLYKLNAFTGTPTFQPAIFKFWLQIGENKIQIGDTVEKAVTGDELGLTAFTATYDQEHLIKAGEKVYLYGSFEFESACRFKRVEAWARSLQTTVIISGLTRTTNSGTESIFVGDALKYLVESATDTAISAKSDFYTADGCGAKRVLFHGYWLRNGGVYLDSPFKLSVQDLLNSLQAIDCAGWNLEYDTENGEVLRVEPIRYFYQNEQIMSFAAVGNIGDKTHEPLLYKKIKIGYETYADEGPQALEDFCTQHTYQTPLRGAENDYEQLSKITASGVLIEKVRRLQFDPENKTATTDDERVFMVCTKERDLTPVTLAVSFGEPYEYQYVTDGEGHTTEEPIPTANSFLISTKPDFFAIGAVIVITGTTDNNNTVTVTDVKYIADISKWVIKIAEFTPQELDTTATFTPASAPLVPENNEYFDVTTGLTDPDIVINLRINPKYMLMAHAPVINSGLTYKGSGANLSLRDCKQNNFLTLQRLDTDPCNGIDPDLSAVQMGGSILLGEMADFFALFSPELLTLTVPATYEQAVYLCNAHLNRAAEANYGYITVLTPDGTETDCYVQNMEYLETEGKMSLQLLKKKS